jgi:hypothetical protein
MSAGGEIRVKRVAAITPHHDAIYEVGKKMLADSVDVGREFSKFMVSLALSAIPIYVGLVGLLGIKHVASPLFFLPPGAFLLAAVLFVFAYFPRQGKYSLDIIEEIEGARDRALNSRNSLLYLAMVSFVGGIVLALGILASVARAPAVGPTKFVTVFIPKDAAPQDAQAMLGKFGAALSARGAGAAQLQEFELDSGFLWVGLVDQDQNASEEEIWKTKP